MDNMFTAQQVAEFLGINLSQIRNLSNSGKLRGEFKDGTQYITADSLTKLVEKEDKFNHLADKLSTLGLNVPEVADIIPEVAAPEIEIPEVSVPDIEMPAVDVPEVSVPEVELPEVTAPEIPEVEVNVPEVEAPTVAEIDKMPDVEIGIDKPEEVSLTPPKVEAPEPVATGGGFQLWWLIPLLILAAIAYYFIVGG